ncbi:MAG: multiheme c-type cytochrome [Leptospirales bacterium]
MIRNYFFIIIIIFAFHLGLSGCGYKGPKPHIKEFVENHWKHPLPAMGKKPEGLNPESISMDPSSCAGCHSEQFEAWQTSKHSHALGPGLMGQLVDLDPEKPGNFDACLKCHTPLAEQQETIIAAVKNSTDTDSVKGLHCLGCHVRDWKWYGPTSRNSTAPEPGDKPDPELAQKRIHGGFTENPAFSDSYFCASCHQFPENWRKLNGKLIENTYNEWKDSSYPEKGIHCQSCHMPERAHLWKGIHDPEMTKSGVDIKLDYSTSLDTISATLKITNSGTGHYFPTYVVPMVFVYAAQFDENNNEIENTRFEYIIGRKTDMSIQNELFDTRIAPGKTSTIEYDKKRESNARFFTVWIVVEPDYFYAQLYRNWLTRDKSARSKKLMQEALELTQKNIFEIYREKRIIK